MTTARKNTNRDEPQDASDEPKVNQLILPLSSQRRRILSSVRWSSPWEGPTKPARFVPMMRKEIKFGKSLFKIAFTDFLVLQAAY